MFLIKHCKKKLSKKQTNQNTFQTNTNQSGVRNGFIIGLHPGDYGRQRSGQRSRPFSHRSRGPGHRAGIRPQLRLRHQPCPRPRTPSVDVRGRIRGRGLDVS